MNNRNGLFIIAIAALNGGVLEIFDMLNDNNPVDVWENGIGGLAADVKNGRIYRFCITVNDFVASYTARVNFNQIGQPYDFKFVSVSE